jgi:type IV pilus assembly protein PilN
MSVNISVNLASEPFRRTRAMLVASGAVAVLLAGLLALLITLSVAEKGQAAEVRQNIARLESQLRTLSDEQSKLEAVLRKPENAEVLDRSLFLNSLLYAKAISWTRLFDDLEKVLPYNVRLIQIRPQVNSQNQISLEMVVGADSSEPVIQMLTRLERSPQFGETLIHNRMPPSQNEPLLRYRLSVNYTQTL